MKRISHAMLVLLLASCSSGGNSEQITIMDKVERGLRLPSGALAWDKYARYYSTEPNGKIVGLFIIPIDPDHQNVFYNLHSGKRRWVVDYRNLPLISDGGCSVVTVYFDPRSGKRDLPFCNGEA